MFFSIKFLDSNPVTVETLIGSSGGGGYVTVIPR